MKAEALKLADDLEYISTLGYPSKLEQQNAITMIRRLVEELDKQTKPLPTTVEEVIAFIGTNFNRSNFFEFDDGTEESVYELTIHDLLSAFENWENFAPQTKPLSDEEILEIIRHHKIVKYKTLFIDFARSIEERHGIK